MVVSSRATKSQMTGSSELTKPKVRMNHFVLLLATLVASGNAANLLLTKHYSGQTTCSGTPTSVTFNEVNVCSPLGDDSSLMYTCGGVLAFDGQICKGAGAVLYQVGDGCESYSGSVTFAEERLCVDADWYRAKISFSKSTCDSNTVVTDNSPKYVVPNGDCTLFHLAGYAKIGDVASDNTTVFSDFGADECSSVPVNLTAQLGVCFNDPVFGYQVVIEKVQNPNVVLDTFAPTSSPTKKSRGNAASNLSGNTMVVGLMLAVIFGLM